MSCPRCKKECQYLVSTLAGKMCFECDRKQTERIYARIDLEDQLRKTAGI